MLQEVIGRRFVIAAVVVRQRIAGIVTAVTVGDVDWRRCLQC